MYSTRLDLQIILGYALLLSSLACSAQDIDLAKDLRAFYPFASQFQGALDTYPMPVGKAIDFTLNRFGDEQGALAFSGNQSQLIIAHDPSLAFPANEAYSISLWIQPRDENSGCIILKENEYGLKWNGMSKPLAVFDGIQGGFPEGKFNDWASSNWYHIALVKNSRQLKLYINGKLDQAWAVKPKASMSPKNMYVGSHPYFWGAFTGKIDDIAMYARALNEYEVMTLVQIENIPIESASVSVPIPDLNHFLGNWQGIITQPTNKLMTNYSFWINFKEIEDGKIEGYTRIEVQQEKAYGVTRMQSFISGNGMNFEETKILRQKNYLGYKWCKKFGQLEYDPKEDVLRGKWYANNCQTGGEILLYRTKTGFNYHDNRLSKPIALNELTERLKVLKTPQKNPLKPDMLQLDLEPIQFQYNRDLLAERSKEYLNQALLPLLQEYPQINLTIVGHTDSNGDDAYNLSLSVRRAKAVRDHLIEQGISEKRISYQGFGESQPIADNKTESGRLKNRRVDFQLSF